MLPVAIWKIEANSPIIISTSVTETSISTSVKAFRCEEPGVCFVSLRRMGFT